MGVGQDTGVGQGMGVGESMNRGGVRYGGMSKECV